MKLDIFVLLFLYSLTRLVNLTKLPIFNDEAILLDWSLRMVNIPGHLFYSLHDSKGPLILWGFGLLANFFEDPLVAGRLFSALTGILTLFGLYVIARKYFSRKVAFLSGLFYIASPLFALYDRQALIEGSLTAIGIWIWYFFLKFIKSKSRRDALSLGIIIAIGLYGKISALFFYTAMVLSLVLTWVEQKTKQERLKLVKSGSIAFFTSQLILLPLYLNKSFWVNLVSNRRYLFSTGEIFALPVSRWWSNLQFIFEVGFWQMGAGVFLLGILGLILVWREKHSLKKHFLVWITVPLVMLLFFARNPVPRYLTVYLPALVILAALAIESIMVKFRKLGLVIMATSLSLSFNLAILQIVNPLSYFSFLKKVSLHSQFEAYVTDWPSGYGIAETVDYLKSKSKIEPLEVLVRYDSGNPENTMFAYFHEDDRVEVNYLKNKLKASQRPGCIEQDSQKSLYFVSRDQRFGGIDNYLTEEQRFYKPYSEHFIGVFRVRTCHDSS